MHVCGGVLADGVVGSDSSSTECLSVVDSLSVVVHAAVEVLDGVLVTVTGLFGMVGVDASNVMLVFPGFVGGGVFLVHSEHLGVGVEEASFPDSHNVSSVSHGALLSVSVFGPSNILFMHVVVVGIGLSVSVEGILQFLMAETLHLSGVVVSVSPDSAELLSGTVSMDRSFVCVDGFHVVTVSGFTDLVPGVESSEPVFHDAVSASGVVSGLFGFVGPDFSVVVSATCVLHGMLDASEVVTFDVLGVEVLVDSVVSLSAELGVLLSEGSLLLLVRLPVAMGVEETEVHFGG